MKNQVIKFVTFCAIVCGSFATANAQTAPATPATPVAPGNAQMGKMSPEQRVEMRASRLKTKLNLTDDQVAKVKDLLTAEVTAHNSGDKEAMKGMKAKMQDGMSKILTPDQMTKYNQMMDQQKARRLGANPNEN